MFYEKIDLYAYCGIERRRSERGFLTVLAPSPCREVKKKLRPAMLVIPGGAYTHVAELEGEPVAVAFMREGYATFLLDYEVCVAYPTPLIQAAMAMRYIRENADTYGIDAKHVCAVGFSAGGHLAGLLSTLYASDDVVRVLGKGCDLCPNATVYAYSVISTESGIGHPETIENITGNDEHLKKRLSVDKLITQNAPPAFIWHTRNDNAVPVENAYRLERAYEQLGLLYELHIFANGPHGLSLCNMETGDSAKPETVQSAVRVWVSLAHTFLCNLGFNVTD